MRFCNAKGMLARWLEELSQYDMVIQHCPGQWSCFESDVDDIVPLTVRSASLVDPLSPSEILSLEFLGQEKTDTNWLPQYSVEELWTAQLGDPDLAKILKWLEFNDPPSTNELYLCSPTVK